MADRIYYCFCDLGCKFETMTKEQIYAAIEQAINEGKITNIDTGFVTKLKELNKGGYVTVWHGTTAEYNALSERDENCIYIKTDDTTFEDFRNFIYAELDNMYTNIENVKEDLEREVGNEIGSIVDIISLLPIENGGTGASSAAEARENLDVYNKKYINEFCMKDFENINFRNTILDDVKTAGFYSAKGVTGSPFEEAVIDVRMLPGGGYRQEARDAFSGVGAMRYTSSDSDAEWSEWEYDNPPMEIAEDGNNPIYKTTRRFCGKPVYTTMIKTKWDNEYTILDLSGTVIDYCGYINNTALPFMVGDKPVCVKFFTYNADGKIHMTKQGGGVDEASTDAYIQIWYVQNS